MTEFSRREVRYSTPLQGECVSNLRLVSYTVLQSVVEDMDEDKELDGEWIECDEDRSSDDYVDPPDDDDPLSSLVPPKPKRVAPTPRRDSVESLGDSVSSTPPPIQESGLAEVRRDDKGRYLRGYSGHSGRSQMSANALRCAARCATRDVLKVWREILLDNGAANRDRIRAGELLIERGYGKAMQPVEVDPTALQGIIVLPALGAGDATSLPVLEPSPSVPFDPSPNPR